MSKKTHNLVVSTGKYTTVSGETKNKYLTVGSILENERGSYIILDRTFNPAGVPNPENKSSVIISMFPAERQAQEEKPQPKTDPSWDNANPFNDDDIAF